MGLLLRNGNDRQGPLGEEGEADRAGNGRCCRPGVPHNLASDIHDFPLQVATLALSPREHIDSLLLVFQKNAFEVEPGTMVEFIDPSTGEEVGKAVPRFDTIASNLPYVDFNTKEIGRYSQIKDELKQEARAAGIKLHDRNDLYCYFCLYLERLLNDGGVACLLTSNTWLFSQAGVSFFEMLALKYQIEGVFVNGRRAGSTRRKS